MSLVERLWMRSTQTKKDEGKEVSISATTRRTLYIVLELDNVRKGRLGDSSKAGEGPQSSGP